MSALPFKVSMALAEYRRIQALGQTKRVELSATEHRVLWCIVAVGGVAMVCHRLGWWPS